MNHQKYVTETRISFDSMKRFLELNKKTGLFPKEEMEKKRRLHNQKSYLVEGYEEVVEYMIDNKKYNVNKTKTNAN